MMIVVLFPFLVAMGIGLIAHGLGMKLPAGFWVFFWLVIICVVVAVVAAIGGAGL